MELFFKYPKKKKLKIVVKHKIKTRQQNTSRYNEWLKKFYTVKVPHNH